MEIRQTEVYAKWFGKLRDRQARARILARIRRLSLGNPGDVAAVGEGGNGTATGLSSWLAGTSRPSNETSSEHSSWQGSLGEQHDQDKDTTVGCR